ncbi:MAG: hypothetical protein IJ083_02850, partial [Clostridia bacterium]|nr:hypothetical protein [Clostridia bacterium]
DIDAQPVHQFPQGVWAPDPNMLQDCARASETRIPSSPQPIETVSGRHVPASPSSALGLTASFWKTEPD